jgi:hypothetical protein
MSELFKIALTAFSTVFAGTVIFCISQIVQKFFIEPIQEQRKVIGKISYALMYYAQWYANPGSGKPDALDRTADGLRQSASRLKASTNANPAYKVWERFGVIRKRSNVDEAVGCLIRISNSIHQGNSRENAEDAKEIGRLLKIAIR